MVLAKTVMAEKCLVLVLADPSYQLFTASQLAGVAIFDAAKSLIVQHPYVDSAAIVQLHMHPSTLLDPVLTRPDLNFNRR